MIVRIKELTAGDQFYFCNAKNIIYIFIKTFKKPSGDTCAQCVQPGKVLPTYFTINHSVIKLNHEKNKAAI